MPIYLSSCFEKIHQQFKVCKAMRRVLILSILPLAVMLILFIMRSTAVKVTIDHGNVLLHMPPKNTKITLNSVLIKNIDNDDDIFWNFSVSGSADPALMPVPTTIVVFKNPTKFSPKENFSKTFQSGVYYGALSYDTWQIVDGHWQLQDAEQQIRFRFCLVRNDQGYLQPCQTWRNWWPFY